MWKARVSAKPRRPPARPIGRVLGVAEAPMSVSAKASRRVDVAEQVDDSRELVDGLE